MFGWFRRPEGRKSLIEEFEDLLGETQKSRAARSEEIRWEGMTVPQWVPYELETLLRAINGKRSERGLAPCSMGDLLRVEKRALGHSDYTHKMALYARNLVEGEM